MMLQSRFAALAVSLLLGAGSLLGTACAYADVDPPSRVARLSYLSGNVSFAPAGEDEWAQASLNRPLITGDRLWADGNSRTELQIGAASIRLDDNSGFNFLNLDDRTAQVELTQGTLNLKVSRLYGDQVYEVDTPTLAFVVSRVGEYRFDVDPNGRVTTVTVFDGAGDVYGEHGSRFSVADHQSVRFNDNELRDYQAFELPPPDGFDQFCFDRDDRQQRSVSREFVSEEVIGASDLDDNGDWQASPEYGHVWYPAHVSAEWAPYRDGHWAWVDPWGWTWVDSAAWGFAPFHYGRWAYVGSRWGWIPGPVNVRPIYAPALVGFVGGHGWSVGIGGGQPIGWFPLGPREVFVPGYHVSRGYFSDVNVHNTTINHNVNITNIYNNYSSGNINVNQTNYAYRNAPNAVTAVPGNVFTGAKPVAASAIRMDRANLERAQVSSIAGIAPNRNSLTAGAAVKTAPPPQAFQRQVVARTAPPATIQPFAQRQGVLAENANKTAPRPNYLPAAAAVAGGAAVGGAAPMHSNVRVVPQATVNAKATPIGPKLPNTGVANGAPGARGGPAANGAPQNANLNPRANGGPVITNPAVTGHPPVNGNAVQGNATAPVMHSNGPGALDRNGRPLGGQSAVTNPPGNATNGNPPKLSDRPPNARAPTGSVGHAPAGAVNNAVNTEATSHPGGNGPTAGNNAAQNAANARNLQNNAGRMNGAPAGNSGAGPVGGNNDRVIHDRGTPPPHANPTTPANNNGPGHVQETLHPPVNNANVSPVHNNPPVVGNQAHPNANVQQQPVPVVRTPPVVNQPRVGTPPPPPPPPRRSVGKDDNGKDKDKDH